MVQKRERGVSPIVATFILIAITVVGGIFLYKFFMLYASTLSTLHTVEITSATLTTSPTIFTINVQNTGNVQVTALTVYMNGLPVNMSLSPMSLSPGGSASGVTSKLPVNISSGHTYYIDVRAVFADNSSEVVSSTVSAS